MNNETLLDLIQFKEIQTLLGENFSALLDIFLRDSHSYAKNICSWGSMSETQDVMMAAHTLKSSAANLGLNKLATQCDLIETACRDEGEIDIHTLISGMQSLYDNSINSLQEAAAT